MKNSYLMDLIRIIKPDEWPDLKMFVASVYHNRGPNNLEIQRLLEIIEHSAPNYVENELNKKRVYEIIFPKKRFIDGKIEKLMSDLNKIIRKFLLTSYYFYETNTFNQTIDLSKILRERNSEARYHQNVSKIESYLEKGKYKIHDYFKQKFILEYEKYDWQSLNNKQKGDINIPSTIVSLDSFYYKIKMDVLTSFLLQKMSTKLEVPFFITNQLESTIIPEYLNEYFPILNISSKIFSLLKSTEPTLDDFNIIKKLINKHEDEIDHMTFRSFCAHLRNICVLLYNSGMNEFEAVLFNLQKEHLEKGYLYYEGGLHVSTFISVVNIAIRCKEYNWVINFIENNKSLILGENDTKDYYRLNLARYYVAVKRFNDALDILPQSFPEPTYNNLARRLELKSYYEINSSLLPYKIDSFKMFILRSSHKYLPVQEREFQNNFINLLFQLTQSPAKDKNRSERLIKRINAKKFVADREWLLEKAAELGKKK